MSLNLDIIQSKIYTSLSDFEKQNIIWKTEKQKLVFTNVKGSTRPICDEKSRAGLLAALFYVDAVILFDDETPINLITKILPDVLVKGSDYTIDQIVGAKEVLANGGEVKTISFLEGYSTSSIEKRIVKAHQ